MLSDNLQTRGYKYSLGYKNIYPSLLSCNILFYLFATRSKLRILYIYRFTYISMSSANILSKCRVCKYHNA